MHRKLIFLASLWRWFASAQGGGLFERVVVWQFSSQSQGAPCSDYVDRMCHDGIPFLRFERRLGRKRCSHQRGLREGLAGQAFRCRPDSGELEARGRQPHSRHRSLRSGRQRPRDDIHVRYRRVRGWWGLLLIAYLGRGAGGRGHCRRNPSVHGPGTEAVRTGLMDNQ